MPKIYPVIHHTDRETTLSEVAKAIAAGADGVFLIAHGGDDNELISVGRQAMQQHPAFPIGVNFLSFPPHDAAIMASKFNFPMLWCDDAGVDSRGLTVAGKNIQFEQRNTVGEHFDVFASVAFKYRPLEIDPQAAAKRAMEAGFIPTTSGSATGSPPEVEKIRSMSQATGGVLAVASGMTPENVVQYAPYLSHILVATGIALDEHRMDQGKLEAFIANAKVPGVHQTGVGVTKGLIQPVPVERGEDGFWVHPHAYDTESHVAMKLWLEAQGLAYSISSLEDEDDQSPAYIDYYEKESASVLAWKPVQPEGEGWFTLSIHDTDDGPVWIWVRRKIGNAQEVVPA